MANRKEIKIDKIKGNSMREIKMWVTSDKPQRFTLHAGTLFYPEKKMAERIQTLILLEDMNVQV